MSFASRMVSVLAEPWKAALVAAVLAGAVHVTALGNGFAYDDETVVAFDEGIRSLSGLPGRLTEPYWPSSYGAEVGSWRPLTTGLFGVTWAVSGGAPAAFHALPLVLHALATALVVLVLASLVTPLAAAAGGLVFAVHPVHVEAVANVVGTAEPLAAVLSLLAVLVHLRGGARYGARRTLAVTALYAAAVLAKEGAVVLPGLLLLLDAARRDLPLRELADYARRRWMLYGFTSVALAVLLVARSAVLGAATSALPPPGMEVLSTMPRIWTLAVTWTHYVRLLVFPLDLASDYGPGIVSVAYGWTATGVLGATLALGALGGAAALWRTSRAVDGSGDSRRTAGLGVLWAALAILPVANVLYLSPVILAERTLYLASVGAVLAFAWCFEAMYRERTSLAWAVLVVVVLAGSARSAARVGAWRDTPTVVATLFEEHPESGRGWWYFGRSLAQEGRDAEARRAFSHALRLLGSEYQVAVDVASTLMAQGRLSSARFFLERAWRERPEWYTAPGLLAAVELQDGRFDQAAVAARAASELEPANASMHHLLAQSLSAAGRPAEAVVARRAALQAGHRSQWRSWLLLGRDLQTTGDLEGAQAALDSAAVVTDSPEAVEEITRARADLTASMDPTVSTIPNPID